MAKKIKQDKQLMTIARKLRRAFEKRKLGAFEQINEYFPSLKTYWKAVLEEQATLGATKFKPTGEGMREMRRLLRRLRGHVSNLAQGCYHLTQRIDTCTNDIDARARCGVTCDLPTLTDCYAQIAALKTEFGTCKLDKGGDKIIVTSNEVQLRSVYFGRYYINISLNAIAADRRSFYRIKPVSAECPTKYGSSHPHLNGMGLCEGKGENAITRAFNEGRLYDCCMLIDSVLRTYGTDPYVKLGEFMNNEDTESDYCCVVCGQGIAEDNMLICEACGEVICSACIRHCKQNGSWICTPCSRESEADNQPCLTDCSGFGGKACAIRVNEPCPECGKIFPDDQLSKCDIAINEPDFCNACAKAYAAGQEPCDSCSAHGRLGCALIRHGYPTLNTLNHPANVFVTPTGRQHTHHSFGWHSVALFHGRRDNDEAVADYGMYQAYLAWQGNRDRARRSQVLTMTHQQLAQLVED